MRTRYRILLVLLAVSAVSGGMLAGWYRWENRLGKRWWEQARRELQARGEKLKFSAFIPPPVPDDQNLALAPLFVRLYQYKLDPRTGLMTFNEAGSAHASETVKTLPYGGGSTPFSVGLGFQPWMTGHALDLAKHQQYFRGRPDFPHAPQPGTAAGDVRLALTRFGPLLEELAQAAAERPLGRFPVNWTMQPPSEIAFPQEAFVQNLILTLRLRATAALALGQTEDAWHDLLLGLRMRQTLEAEPVLIARLVDVVCLESLLQPWWEGLAEHRWSDQQVAGLQAQLGQVDLIRDCQRSRRADRAGVVIPFADDIARSRTLRQLQQMQAINGNNADDSFYYWAPIILRTFPKGWFAEAKAVACRLDQQGCIDLIQPEAHRVAARGLDEAAMAVHQLPVLPSTFIAKVCLPVNTSVIAKAAQAQASVDEAVVACALERFFLGRGAYPEKLDALVPAFLDHVPTDVIDGAPMRYRQTSDGRYRLWEVGWNGKDEGGTIVFWEGSPKPDGRRGDWVWQYQATDRTGSNQTAH